MVLVLPETNLMLTPFSGKCACRSISYIGNATPAFAWNCQCRDCQRASGGGQCPVLYVPKSAVELQGDLTYYTVKAESGNGVDRGFCGTCGSPMCIRAELVPELIGLWAGSLDDPEQFSPQINVWTSSAPNWIFLNENLPHSDHAPTAAQLQRLLES